MKSKLYIVVVAGVVVLFSSFLVSAGLQDWWAGITGRATSGETNATVTLLGDSEVVVRIYNETIGVVSPIEANTTRVTFTVNVNDDDGVNDINDSSVSINISRGTELVKTNSSCSVISGESNSTGQNYSCSFDFWYFEEAGSWLIYAEANDFGSFVYNYNHSYLNYASLNAMVIAPNSISWPGLSPGGLNQTATDTTFVNNTGNYNIDNLTITGQDLIGETDSSYIIHAENFTVDIETGAGVECVVDSSGAGYINDTQVEIISAVANRGNLSIGGGTAQEVLYYCIPLVPPITSQTYSTSASDEWIITTVEN